MYEIQFHPADIRQQVRYFFVSRRTFRWLTAIAGTLAVLIAAGTLLAPLGLQSLVLSSELRVLRQQSALQREILGQRQSAIDRLDREIRQARSLQQQMSLILGAPQTGQTSSGGFPETVADDYSVPEARASAEQAATMLTESRALLALIDELASFARANRELTASVPAICPVGVGTFVLTSPFGDRVSPFTSTTDFHAGIDLAAREGTRVMAAGGGRVVFAGRFPLNRNVRWWRYGNVVVINHDDRYLTIYAHLETIEVQRGEQVERGATIGTVGNTGWSTSPHLHYEVRVVAEIDSEPVPVDPRIYILDYQWRGHEELLVRGRAAPPPNFDPLPSLVKVR